MAIDLFKVIEDGVKLNKSAWPLYGDDDTYLARIEVKVDIAAGPARLAVLHEGLAGLAGREQNAGLHAAPPADEMPGSL